MFLSSFSFFLLLKESWIFEILLTWQSRSVNPVALTWSHEKMFSFLTQERAAMKTGRGKVCSKTSSSLNALVLVYQNLVASRVYCLR